MTVRCTEAPAAWPSVDDASTPCPISGSDCGRLVLRPDIAAVDREPSFGIDADEDAGAGDLGRIVDHGPVFERHQCRFDLAETLIDLVGQFVGVLVVGFELGLLGVERVDGRLLLGGEIGRFALQFAQAAGVAVGEIDGDRDPLPALRGDRLGLRRQLLGDETIEQGDILQPAAIVVLEQIAQDAAACLLVGVEPDELRAAVGGADGLLPSACGGSGMARRSRSG